MQGNTSTPSAPFLRALRFRGGAGDYTDELPGCAASSGSSSTHG
jgi:hypothetical protein